MKPCLLSRGPDGGWRAARLRIPTTYLNGTDTYQVKGIDIPQVRYYGYGWNGHGNINNQNLLTQLGYPCGINNCTLMQRDDSVGSCSGNGSGTTPLQYMIGSQMTGVSSGGPWIVNFGTQSTLTGAGAGAAVTRNIVQGTTSWGYTD